MGLTGGIASGKSTVSRRLSELGAVIVDADAVARQLQEPGEPGYRAIVEHFGSEVVESASGALNRAAIAQIVFNDESQLAMLNAIMHPLIHAQTTALVDSAPPGSVVVHDHPLLVETGRYAQMDHVLVVEAPVEERVRRMMTDRGMSEADARARIAAQATDQERRCVATRVLENSGTQKDLLVQVEDWWREIRN